MTTIFTVLFLYLLYVYGIAYGLPILARLLFYLAAFLITSLRVALSFLARICLPHALAALAKAFNQIGRFFIFAAILFDEIFNPGSDQQEHEDFEEAEAEENEDNNERILREYLKALRILSLTPGFTRDEFSKAFKNAIRKAHPDVPGGSNEAAQDVNNAREVIMSVRGWA